MKRKNKKKPIIIFLILIIILGFALFFLLNKEQNEKHTKINEVSDNDLTSKIKKEKYYIESNLDRYLKYAENNTDLEISKIITNVNSNLDKTKYEDTEKTNIKDDNLMLVNKYYYLTEDYTPNDLVTLTSKYNTGINSQMRKEAANNFMKMSDAATLDNITIKNASGYRSYNYQVNLYDKYVQRDGKKAADTYSARPGFSEHQTGLVSDINQIDNSFENTDAFKWLQKNAYKYGFILRFPKDKEDVTGYQYEPWHYRYVGEYVAEKIHDENLTLEEYYAYYIQNKK
ncbi:MAG: M15 family metallopeptidase [Bacilli bacterium]|nr:M15 family metallopeptidase [Bacilli bacterium]